MAAKHQGEDGVEEDNSSVGDQDDEEKSNASQTTSTDEADMESSVTVWNYYADVAWKNALEETNSMLRSTDDNRDIDKKTKKKWMKIMDKYFVDAYRSDLLHYLDLKEDPVHNSVMLTKKKMMQELDMDSDEATKAAVDQRKFLILNETPDWLAMLTNETIDLHE